jgi:hypothetical protein
VTEIAAVTRLLGPRVRAGQRTVTYRQPMSALAFVAVSMA